MSNSKQQTFLKGALVLGTANLLVKVIGAFFKIPLTNLIDNDGSGLFSVAYQIYTFMFIIATAGFPIAVSKMVAESVSRGSQKDARRVFETAFLLLGIVGIIGSTVLFVFAQPLANLFHIPDAALGIRAISPAVFFVAMVSAFRGYFQGQQNMYPTAASEVIEASAKLGIGIIIAMLFMRWMTVDGSISSAVDFSQMKVESLHSQTIFAAAGANFGVTSGTILAFILLGIIYLVHKHRNKLPQNGETLRPRSTILKELVLIAVPITIGASVSSLTTLIDMSTIANRLVINPNVFEPYSFLFADGTKFAAKAVEEGMSVSQQLTEKATALYGMYTNKALTIFNLPLTLVTSLGISVVPAISAALAVKNRTGAARLTDSVLRIAILFALPCAVGVSILSKEILMFLFKTTDAHIVLSELAIAIIWVSVVSVTNAVLQAYGKVYYPVWHMLIGGIAKVLINWFFIPVWGIDGAPIATNVCYFLIAALNLFSIVRVAGIKIKLLDYIIKPLLAALAMGAAVWLLSRTLPISRLNTLVEIAAAAVVYAIAIFAVRAVREEDVLQLPKGQKLAALLKKFKLIG